MIIFYISFIRYSEEAHYRVKYLQKDYNDHLLAVIFSYSYCFVLFPMLIMHTHVASIENPVGSCCFVLYLFVTLTIDKTHSLYFPTALPCPNTVKILILHFLLNFRLF